MRAHIIENDTITGTILVDSLDFLPNLIDASIGGGIGWGYVDGVLVPPPPLPEPPITVSPRQIRQALTATGIRGEVEYAISSADQNTKDWWEFATAFEELHPMVDTMCSALNIDDTQRHAVFALAATL